MTVYDGDPGTLRYAIQHGVDDLLTLSAPANQGGGSSDNTLRLRTRYTDSFRSSGSEITTGAELQSLQGNLATMSPILWLNASGTVDISGVAELAVASGSSLVVGYRSFCVVSPRHVLVANHILNSYFGGSLPIIALWVKSNGDILTRSVVSWVRNITISGFPNSDVTVAIIGDAEADFPSEMIQAILPSTFPTKMPSLGIGTPCVRYNQFEQIVANNVYSYTTYTMTQSSAPISNTLEYPWGRGNIGGDSSGPTWFRFGTNMALLNQLANANYASCSNEINTAMDTLSSAQGRGSVHLTEIDLSGYPDAVAPNGTYYYKSGGSAVGTAGAFSSFNSNNFYLDAIATIPVPSGAPNWNGATISVITGSTVIWDRRQTMSSVGTNLVFQPSSNLDMGIGIFSMAAGSPAVLNFNEFSTITQTSSASLFKIAPTTNGQVSFLNGSMSFSAGMFKWRDTLSGQNTQNNGIGGILWITNGCTATIGSSQGLPMTSGSHLIIDAPRANDSIGGLNLFSGATYTLCNMTDNSALSNNTNSNNAMLGSTVNIGLGCTMQYTDGAGLILSGVLNALGNEQLSSCLLTCSGNPTINSDHGVLMKPDTFPIDLSGATIVPIDSPFIVDNINALITVDENTRFAPVGSGWGASIHIDPPIENSYIAGKIGMYNADGSRVLIGESNVLVTT